MGKQSLVKVWVLLVVSVLALSLAVETASATLTLENVRTWYWTDSTYIRSVAEGDVDADGKAEVVTGGYYSDGANDVAQLCVWDGASFALENVKTWQWGDNTRVESVAVGDVDGDGALEIVTGGYYNYDDDGPHYAAQLCIWSGASLTLENVKTWEWEDSSVIWSVALGDVDGDEAVEIVTGGHYAGSIAQLCVWSGASLTLENIQCWHWNSFTYIESVALGDVDGDGALEIVTGGWYWDPDDVAAQLCVWSGSSLALENVKTWKWPTDTLINSAAVGDVDGDGALEIVTGGYYNDGSRNIAQLCVWSGSSLALENVKTWYWGVETIVYSVALGDVDSDGAVEIVTGGEVIDAQLCVWDGASLALENIQIWDWGGITYIRSVAVGDVNGDLKAEIATGGYYWDYTRYNAQLCVWAG